MSYLDSVPYREVLDWKCAIQRIGYALIAFLVLAVVVVAIHWGVKA